MEDSPEAENPDTAPEQDSNLAAVLDTPAVTPLTRSGTLEEAPAPDPQSESDGIIAAIPSQPRMLTRSQSRRTARAGTALAAEVTTDDDPRSYREAMNGPLQCQWKVAMGYTLNITGRTFGYGPGRKVSETRHTVLGRHTETAQPTPSGLGSGQPTLQHRMILGQVPA